MNSTIICNDHPTFADLKHNCLVFLRQNIEEVDEYLASCPPENYAFSASIRETQLAHLRIVAAANSKEELHREWEKLTASE